MKGRKGCTEADGRVCDGLVLEWLREDLPSWVGCAARGESKVASGGLFWSVVRIWG